MDCYYGVDVFFFFFQAEDGIRDLTVTGVQTCALPISRACCVWRFRQAQSRCAFVCAELATTLVPVKAERTEPALRASTIFNRSEERRVGKECRSRRSPYH